MNHKHTNLLIRETSPYLLQHAHNPVQWRPWGQEALDAAQKEDKPIIVSIGYAACHWCHVMERESFENEETAKLMNENFINIKIDREERPDIDHIYMDAVQAMTGSGGWPLNVFLMPDGKPFYGGTYFPPVRAHGKSSWTEILNAVKDAYDKRKTELESQAENLTEHLKNSNLFGSVSNNQETLFSKKSIEELTHNLLKNADKELGGFGSAPKFPQTFSIQFLLRNYYYSGNQESLRQALLSLDKMICGGIYDHLGGGFARYSTDEKWLAPHFEKMLYDNALIINVLSEAYQLTKIEAYKTTIEQTMEFIQRELMDTDGGFFSALDADSEGVEGKFYTWSKSEIEDVLKADAAFFCSFFDVSEEGNWEHTNILWIKSPIKVFAQANGVEEEFLKNVIQEGKAKLFESRRERIRPVLDDKKLLGWNALMNIACSKAYAATGNLKYKELAERNMDFLETAFTDSSGGLWLHSFKNGIAKYPAFLDDYAYLINAYIHLQEITANEQYLLKARQLTELVNEHFIDSETGLFFYTHKNQNDVIVRKKEVYDGAIPSGNAIMAINIRYLSVIFDLEAWQKQSISMVSNLGNAIKKFPTSFGNWTCLLQELVYGISEIIITGNDIQSSLFAILNEYFPGKIMQGSTHFLEGFPLLYGKDFYSETLIYICRNSTCETPVKTIDEIKSLLK